MGEGEKREAEEEEAFTCDELSEAFAEEKLGCGDAFVEGLSVKHSVPRMAEAAGVSSAVINYALAALYFVVGVLCVSITDIITHVLPYIVGSMMILIGTVEFIVAMVRREYRNMSTNKTATSLIIAALGVMIIVESVKPDSTWAITLISIVWGVLGLFEGAHAFNRAFYRIANSQCSAFYLAKGLIEVIVAFMLLYQPDNHNIHTFHIIVFGINLIIDSVTMLPAVKRFLRRTSSVE